MPPTRHNASHPGTPLASLALGAIVLFFFAAVAVHLLRPALDGAHAQLSVYLVGPWSLLLRAGYVALAVGILALAIALYRVPPPASRSAAPLLLFAIAAPALAVTAFAPMRFPGEDVRLVHVIHATAAQAAFLCTTAAMLLQAWRLRAAGHWRRISPALLGWAAACFTGVWVLALVRELPRGASQKLLVLMILAWLCAVALHLRREPTAPAG